MTIAYWTILAACLLPFVWTSAAKWGGDKRLSSKENHNPREFLASLSGLPARANAAQHNAFEALPIFIAAVLIAHNLGVAQATIDGLALAWLGLRVAHGICYLKDWAEARSLVWFAALGCCIALFVIAA